MDTLSRWAARVSLRSRLISISVLAVVPLLVIAFINADRERDSAIEARGQHLANLAQLAATAYQQASDGALAALESIQADPSVAANEQPFCNRLLERMGAAHPAFSAFSVLDTDGIVRCSGQADLLGASGADREYFQEALASRSLAVSGFLISRPANIPIIVYAEPLFAGHEQLSGVLILSLELSWFSEMLDSLPLADDVRITVIDRVGQTLVRIPRDGVNVGDPANYDSLGTGVFEAGGYVMHEPPDHDAVVVGFAPIPGPGGALGAVMVEEASATVTAEAASGFRLYLGTIVLVTGGGMVLIWVGMTRTVQQPLHELVNTTRRFAAGVPHRPSVTSPFHAAEVRELVHSFDSMAEQVTESQDVLRRLATTDDLTGLPNRNELERRIGTLLKVQPDRAPIVMAIGFREFAQVNSTFGYVGGDEVLRQVGRLLTSAVPSADVGRIGGDEFGVLVPGAAAGDPQRIARTLMESLSRPFTISGEPIRLEVTGGYVVAGEDGREPEVLLRRAQLAQRAALGSPEAFVRFDEARDEPPQNQVHLLSELRAAIGDGDLELWYQPKISLQSLQVVGVESLLRWPGVDGTYVPPGVFIPLAERAGIVTSITRWVIAEAARQAGVWAASGRTLPIAVNASARDLVDPQLPAFIEESLTRHGVTGPAIEIEITETDLMADPDEALVISRALREMGVKLAIDDFGTGYSPLVYLHRLPVTALKIDQSFVRGLSDGDESERIILSIVQLAHRLDVSVIAEGIEDAGAVDTLRDLGCDDGQGYYFSPPMRAVELEAWLDTRESPGAALEEPPPGR